MRKATTETVLLNRRPTRWRIERRRLPTDGDRDGTGLVLGVNSTRAGHMCRHARRRHRHFGIVSTANR